MKNLKLSSLIIGGILIIVLVVSVIFAIGTVGSDIETEIENNLLYDEGFQSKYQIV